MRIDKSSFIWGIVFTLFIIILIFPFSILISSIFFEFPLQNILIFTVFTVFFVAIFVEIGLTFYYVMFFREKRNSLSRLNELEIRLKSIESAKKETQKRYYERKISEETYKRMMEKFEAESTALESEINTLKKYVRT